MAFKNKKTNRDYPLAETPEPSMESERYLPNTQGRSYVNRINQEMVGSQNAKNNTSKVSNSNFNSKIIEESDRIRNSNRTENLLKLKQKK